jgi:hypothetical protein
MVNLIASHDRLNPVFNADAKKNLAVHAAQTLIKHDDGTEKYSVCAGNYNSFPGGRPAHPGDSDLNSYLNSLKTVQNPTHWPYFVRAYTPRRAFGPGADVITHDIGGTLVWGQACAGIRHFDCVGFISFCLAAAGGPVIQLSIAAWRANPHSQGATVYELKTRAPKELLDGDILVKADHHIAWWRRTARSSRLRIRTSGCALLAASVSPPPGHGRTLFACPLVCRRGPHLSQGRNANESCVRSSYGDLSWLRGRGGAAAGVTHGRARGRE